MVDVSICIATYNSCAYLNHALNSVLNQTYSNYEIIVVDDGSNDGTRRSLEPHLRTIKYFYQEHRGVAAARNTGIRKATGKFIAFLDADDLWLPDKLQLQMNYFGCHRDCGLVYTDMKTFDENGIIQESVKASLDLDLPSGYIFGQLFADTLFGTGSAIVGKECLDKVGPFDETLLAGEDYDMWLRIARHFKVGYVDKPLLMYRRHPGMTTHTIGRTLCDGVPWEVKVLQKILDLYPEIVSELGRVAVRRRLSKAHFRMASVFFEQGDYVHARKLLLQSLKYYPSNLRYQLFYLISFLGPSQVSTLRSYYRRLSRLTSGPPPAN